MSVHPADLPEKDKRYLRDLLNCLAPVDVKLVQMNIADPGASVREFTTRLSAALPYLRELVRLMDSG